MLHTNWGSTPLCARQLFCCLHWHIEMPMTRLWCIFSGRTLLPAIVIPCLSTLKQTTENRGNNARSLESFPLSDRNVHETTGTIATHVLIRSITSCLLYSHVSLRESAKFSDNEAHPSVLSKEISTQLPKKCQDHQNCCRTLNLAFVHKFSLKFP
jgi:hypothetical protein